LTHRRKKIKLLQD